jgi:hypothetical protein
MPANQYMEAAKAKCHLRRVGMTYQRAKPEVGSTKHRASQT